MTEEEEKGDTWHWVERRRRSFSRRFQLPENANMARITCTMENGVLAVTAATPNVRTIDVALATCTDRNNNSLYKQFVSYMDAFTCVGLYTVYALSS
ncbi:hypothetical protein C4D60_Mb06t22650 [Musa balbisiana]|uniref:SHSP domain-containing protein n=1 Tax=Musa balbisiana TaxID=52838 RepID=A0A4S8ISG7_MUSBA|nr:hypothetical protein C4D60_Mb06t22650 [Musa balbisiana]